VWGWGTPAGRERAARRATLISRGAGLRPGLRVLEIGCGTGVFTEHFARTGAEILAVDISEALVARARTRGLPASVRFLCRAFEECGLDGPFDAVVGSSVLHHLSVPGSLQKIYDLLAPGGVFSFAEPNMLNPQVFLQKNVPVLKRWAGDSPEETAFLRWRFRRMLRAIGFADVTVLPFDWLHSATPARLIEPIRRVGLALERTPGLREFAGSLYIRAVRRPADA
jgi:SAM-dependent methyltransferase